jgi:hypothetical protein
MERKISTMAFDLFESWSPMWPSYCSYRLLTPLNQKDNALPEMSIYLLQMPVNSVPVAESTKRMFVFKRQNA